MELRAPRRGHGAAANQIGTVLRQRGRDQAREAPLTISPRKPCPTPEPECSPSQREIPTTLARFAILRRTYGFGLFCFPSFGLRGSYLVIVGYLWTSTTRFAFRAALEPLDMFGFLTSTTLFAFGPALPLYIFPLLPSTTSVDGEPCCVSANRPTAAAPAAESPTAVPVLSLAPGLACADAAEGTLATDANVKAATAGYTNFSIVIRCPISLQDEYVEICICQPLERQPYRPPCPRWTRRKSDWRQACSVRRLAQADSCAASGQAGGEAGE